MNRESWTILSEGTPDTQTPINGTHCEISYEIEYEGVVIDRQDGIRFMYGNGAVSPAILVLLNGMTQNMKIRTVLNSTELYGTFGCPVYGVPPGVEVSVTLELTDLVFPEDLETEVKLSIDELKELSMKLKEKGNECIKSKDYTGAKEYYSQAILKFSKEILNMTDEQEIEVNLFLVPFYSNMALCDINMQQYSDAISHCKWILDIEPDNAKAHYRIGVAYENARLYSESLWHLKQRFLPHKN
eukprot:TRINITY_DN3437_c0_g1_i1.p1 TRINITY_DN3437_c0_g1~~TRINITY_DN3437_c0_g1_i1.p1  ORF type:complete len:243 (+),score=45.40 TRINITY_DN3437_c0_g1_i1:287-1015(+)